MSLRYTALVVALAALAASVVAAIPNAGSGVATVTGSLAAVTAILLQPQHKDDHR